MMVRTNTINALNFVAKGGGGGCFGEGVREFIQSSPVMTKLLQLGQNRVNTYANERGGTSASLHARPAVWDSVRRNFPDARQVPKIYLPGRSRKDSTLYVGSWCEYCPGGLVFRALVRVDCCFVRSTGDRFVCVSVYAATGGNVFGCHSKLKFLRTVLNLPAERCGAMCHVVDVDGAFVQNSFFV